MYKQKQGDTDLDALATFELRAVHKLRNAIRVGGWSAKALP